MLILTRHPTERIYIGDEIHIVVVSIDRNQVRLGISAPKDVLVLREEVRQRLVEQDAEH